MTGVRWRAAAIAVFIVVSGAFVVFSAASAPVTGRGAPPPAYNTAKPTAAVQTAAPPTAAPTDEPMEPIDTNEARAREILAAMTEDEKLYQLFIVTPEALMPGLGSVSVAGETMQKALELQPVGGIIYSKQNLIDAEQTTEMLATMQSCSRLPLFLGVDEEGGRVSRVSFQSAMGFEKAPAMAKIGETGDPAQAYAVGSEIGQMLRELGFNLDFAPVADVLVNPGNKVIGDRSFGSEPELVALMTASFTQGLRDSGIAASLKHFPGQGGTTDDTHNGRSVSERTLEELRGTEFLPFASGIEAGADFVMLAHISAVNVDTERPASLSPEIVGLLRRELGFERVIITDALDMGAITDIYSSGGAAAQAIVAGVDVLLMPKNLDDAVKGLRDALETGQLTWERIDESIVRILKVKLERGIVE